MVPLPPPPAPLPRTWGVCWGVLAVEYVVYSSSAAWKLPSFLVFGVLELLHCGAWPAANCLQLSVFHSVEVALAPASWSILPPPLADKASVCLVSRSFCHLRCARCPPVWLVCILSFLAWNLPSGLVWCVVSPATECKLPSILIFYNVKVALLCGILLFLLSTLPELLQHCIFCSMHVALVPRFWGRFSCCSVQIGTFGGTAVTDFGQQVRSPGDTLPRLPMTIRRKPHPRKGYISILSETILTA